jgi:hypothetical protein
MQYFKHYGTMRHDIKIKRLVKKYGLEGYGLYCLVLESITENLTTENPLPNLQETCEDIADFYNGNTARINEIAAFMLNQGLIELDHVSESIACSKIYKYLEANSTRSEAIRNMIKSYKCQAKQLTDENASGNNTTAIQHEKNRVATSGNEWANSGKNELTGEDDEKPSGNNITAIQPVSDSHGPSNTKVIEQEQEQEQEQEYINDASVVDSETLTGIYSLYPSRCPFSQRSTGKSKTKNQKKIKAILKTMTAEELTSIIKLYIADCSRSKTFLKNFGTFLNNLPDIDDLAAPDDGSLVTDDPSMPLYVKDEAERERLQALGIIKA